MTHTTFDEWACRSTQAKLDSYIDDELLTETNLELAQHFQRCEACAREATSRRELRARVRAAARTSSVPSGLDDRVRARLREASRPQPKWHLMAIAAVLLVAVSAWLGSDRLGFSTSTRLAAMLGIGAGNHIHCAVGRQSVTKPVGLDKLAEEYKPVLAIARQAVPSDMPLAVAHECTYRKRKFVHVTFRNDRHLLSVIVTRRADGESLSIDARAALSEAGISMYAGRVDRYQTAAFESDGFLVYTVSDLSRSENLRVLASLAPALRIALRQIAA